MSEEDVQAQIEQMIKFIKQEANEKADEIRVKAEEDFTISKQDEVEAEKKRIRMDYERKEKQIEVEKKISYSNAINSNRLKVLKARDDAVQNILEAARKQIAKSASGSAYDALLKKLVVQGVQSLQEKDVDVQCRKSDLGAVKKAVKDANLGSSVTVNEKDFLPANSAGGVSVSALGGQICCDNTLDTRLDIAFQGMLPQIRVALFGRSASRKYDS